MLLSLNTAVWFYPSPIDFRKQLDGLILLIVDCMELNPTSGHVFVFRNRGASKIKIVWWDKNGFWLLYKRLEKGKFKFPAVSDKTLELTTEQMSWLLTGLDFTKHTPLPSVTATHFY